MFEKEKIKALAESKLNDFDGFLVDLVVSNDNKILLEIDSPRGISIGECAELNRFLNKELDNETNEFELTVSSPGLEKPFKVYKQYEKNLNRQVKVRTVEGKEYTAKLSAVNKEGISLAAKVKEVPEGKTRKEWVDKSIELPFEQIKETKVIITFK
ncbi:MAG TPA: ribosome assembly cofactor RimP [Flavobacteriales bacterium]|nr:ribosome assembly cofactor RimP [Flavobacteriales bacterium]